MAQLRLDYQKFTNRQAEVVAIGPDDQAAFNKFWKDYNLPFIGLPDPDVTVLRLYGQKVNLLKLGRMPAQMVLDRDGRLRYIHYSDSMSDIPANSEILGILDTLNQENAVVQA